MAGALFGARKSKNVLVKNWATQELAKLATEPDDQAPGVLLNEGERAALVRELASLEDGKLLYAVDGEVFEPVAFAPRSEPFTGKLAISSASMDAAFELQADDGRAQRRAEYLVGEVQVVDISLPFP